MLKAAGFGEIFAESGNVECKLPKGGAIWGGYSLVDTGSLISNSNGLR